MLDVRIRMRAEELTEVRPTHLFSEIASATPTDLASPESAPIKGTTEWIAEGQRKLTFGWEWTYEPVSARYEGCWHTLSTNLLVVDSEGTDMGVDCLRLCVARLMTRSHWETVIAAALRMRPCH
jgi:Domain of unknown function (DUF4902)